MYILPLALPGETPAGYAMRATLVSGRSSLKAASEHFFGRTGLQPPLILPGNLAFFAQRTHYATGESLNAVIERRTVLPALTPFLSREAQQSIDAHLMGSSSMRSPYTFLGLATAAGAPKHSHLFCPRCVQEGIESHGWSYWRREHQIPFIRMCPHHAEPLTSGCGECKYSEPSARHLALPPLKRCWCGSKFRPVETLSTAAMQASHLRYAAISHELLEGGLADVGYATTIGVAYKHRAEELGFVRSGRVDRKKATSAFEEHHGLQFLSFHRSTHDATSSWFANGLAKGIVPPSMARNIMLIDLLFGSVKSLMETINSLASAEATQPRRSIGNWPSRPISATRLEFCQRELVEFRRRNPELSRNEILRSLGSTAIDLRKHARAWYEEHMPPPAARGGRRSNSEPVLRQQANDLKEHILARYQAEMSSQQKPRRVTMRFLFIGQPLKVQAKELCEAVPQLGEFIASLLEDRHQFKRRKVRWFYNNPRSIPTGADPIKFVARSTGLTTSLVAGIFSDLSRTWRA